MKNLETDKAWLENNEALKTMRTIMEQSKDTLYSLESEACKDLTYDRLDGSQVDLEKVFKNLESEKYEVEVSESKKVRLEADDDDLTRLSRRLEILENDNKRLSCELNSIRASKVMAEAKVEALMTDKIRLEIELLKERTKRVYSIDSSMLPSETRDRDMNASVAVVSDSSSSRDAATSPEPSRRSSSKSICFHPSLSSYIHKKVAEKVAKMVQQGIVTTTSCNPGDVVLIVWDTVHGNYAVYQESSTLYFLHSDYVDALEIGMNLCGSRKCVLAEVIDKEYCHARKVIIINYLMTSYIIIWNNIIAIIRNKTLSCCFIFSMKIGTMSHVAQNFTECALNLEMYAYWQTKQVHRVQCRRVNYRNFTVISD